MVQRIDSVLLHKILTYQHPDELDFTLSATYCTLKKHRNKTHSYQPHDKLKGYNLLQHHTNISSHVLRKNVPLLIEMGLCHFLDNGGFFMVGNHKTKSKKYKLVPIRIYEKLCTTKTAVKYVIEHSNIASQKRMAIKKEGRSELLKASDNNSIRSLNQLKRVKKLHKKGILCQNDLNFVKTAHLSNRRIGELMGGNDCPYNQKSRGLYLKNKFRKMGLHQTKRRFKKVSTKKYTLEEYLQAKYDLREHYSNITWMKGYIYTELASEIIDTSENIEVVLCEKTSQKPYNGFIEDYMRVREYDGTLHPFLIQKQYL